MKKSFKKRLKGWKIGDYVRQFSIVTGGVLLTLWLTTKITDAAKQREVRQAVHLVMFELKENQDVIAKYRQRYNDDKRIAQSLIDANFALDGFPADTVEFYSQRITGGMGKPYLLSNDALEMLKTTGLASHIADKQLLTDLLRCYKELASFDDLIGLYYQQRQQVILPVQMESNHWNSPIRDAFEKTLADKNVQNWIGILPRSFDTAYFTQREELLEQMIVRLGKTYD